MTHDPECTDPECTICEDQTRQVVDFTYVPWMGPGKKDGADESGDGGWRLYENIEPIIGPVGPVISQPQHIESILPTSNDT